MYKFVLPFALICGSLLFAIGYITYKTQFQPHCEWENCPKNWDCEEGTDCGLIEQIHTEHPDWSPTKVEEELFAPGDNK